MYSRCQLTVSTDKKMALVGIVQWVWRGRDLRYIEGLWCRETLVPQQLLWASDRTEPLARPSFRGAPSWSWLSVDGGITFPIRVPPESDPVLQPGATSGWQSCCTISIHPGGIANNNNNTQGTSEPTDKAIPVLCLQAKVLSIDASTLHQYSFQPDCAAGDAVPLTVFAISLVERVPVYSRLLIGSSSNNVPVPNGLNHSKGFAGLILTRCREGNRFMRMGMFKLEPPRVAAPDIPLEEERERDGLLGLARIVEGLPMSTIEVE